MYIYNIYIYIYMYVLLATFICLHLSVYPSGRYGNKCFFSIAGKMFDSVVYDLRLYSIHFCC